MAKKENKEVKTKVNSKAKANDEEAEGKKEFFVKRWVKNGKDWVVNHPKASIAIGIGTAIGGGILKAALGKTSNDGVSDVYYEDYPTVDEPVEIVAEDSAE